MDARIPATPAEFEQETVLAARCVRGFVTFPLKKEGAGNAGCPLHPQPRVQSETSTRVYSPQVHRTVRRFLRNGVTAYSVLSPANRAFLPPSPAKKFPRT